MSSEAIEKAVQAVMAKDCLIGGVGDFELAVKTAITAYLSHDQAELSAGKRE